ncbi:uncharacterized protein JCM6883_000812 [Sporobolomyces salmoneus]|uniref:uncharacterized protein n=1 Tax=Sporobolomyces salmoneus TaxID=183962 RepID=UPI00318243DD
MIWSEIVVCWIFAVLCWLYLVGEITHSFAFFFSILTCWALQVQFLLYCIWIPARLQISHRYEQINIVWDRVEKCIYLVVDAALNLWFMRCVNQRLVGQGLERYRPLVRFNRNLIWISIGCDVMIIGLMSLPNSFTYMRDLIVTISSAKPVHKTFDPNFEGLKIAVSTHTTTTAVRFDDPINGDDNEKTIDGLRKTRTPARPDLSIRLEKIRRDRKARKAAEADGAETRHGGEVHSDGEDDVKIDMEMEESANWDTAIHHLPAHGTYSPASGSGSFVDEKL